MTMRILRMFFILAWMPCIATAQTISEIDVPAPNAHPFSVAAASDGSIWFTMPGAESIGRINSDRTLTAFGTLTTPHLITAASDGRLWFTSSDSTIIGVIDSSGALSQAGSGFTHRGIAAGGESMWVTANFG